MTDKLNCTTHAPVYIGVHINLIQFI